LPKGFNALLSESNKTKVDLNMDTSRLNMDDELNLIDDMKKNMDPNKILSVVSRS
jgi:hypothetical protein